MRQLQILSCTTLTVMCLLGAAPNDPAASNPNPPIALAQDGRTPYAIVIASKAHDAEKLAAEELAYFLKKMTGAVFPIRLDDAPPIDTEIVVGHTARKALDNLPPHLRADNWEGFAIVREGDRLLIMGNIPRGTLYGVYDFLDVELGVRFLAHRVNHVPTRPTLKVPVTSRVYGPPLERRTIWEGGLLGDATRRNRLNGISFQVLDEKMLGGVKTIGRGTHSFTAFLPHTQYFAEHPEYFAFIDGQRRERYKMGIVTQPCMSNPDVLRIAMDAVLSLIEEANQKNPYNKYLVEVSVNDSPWHCKCDVCTKVNDAEGGGRGAGGPQVLLVNAIADRVAKQYPNALIKTMFYQSDPPQNTRLATNVVLETVSTIDWRYPFDDLSKPGNRVSAEDWGKSRRAVGDGSLYVWEKHQIQFGDYFLPNPNLRHIAHNIGIMIDKYRLKGYFAQNTQSPGTDLQTLRYYLLARAMWRPQNDSWRELEEFCRLYYGPAADDVMRYLDYMHDDYGMKAPSRGDSKREFTRADKERYIETADAILSEAESRADTYNTRLWIATLRLSVWKSMLNLAFDDMKNDPAYVPTDRVRTAGRRFIETGRAARVTHMGESYGGPNVQTERSFYPRVRKLLRHGRPEDQEDPWITDDDGLKNADLSKARRLNLCGSEVTDAGLAALSGLTQLEALDLRYTFITDEGLAHLANLENLAELHLGGFSRNVGTKITDHGIEHLRNMKKLTRLSLGGTKVGDDSMKIVRGMTGLKHLELWQTKVADDGLADVAALADLEHLDIFSTQTTNLGIGHLQRLERLKLVNLYDVTRVTDDAVDALRQAVPDLHVRQY